MPRIENEFYEKTLEAAHNARLREESGTFTKKPKRARIRGAAGAVKNRREPRPGAMPARLLLHGADWVEDLDDGYARPHRLNIAEERAVSSVRAWHPGLYRQMATSTAGVCIEFLCEADRIALEVIVDGVPSGSASAIGYIVDPALKRRPDGFACIVDDCPLPVVMPEPGRSTVTFDFSNVADARPKDTGMLPGLGQLHHVRIWLPSLRGCSLGDVMAEGYMEPVGERPALLVLGDSISQGFFSGDAAHGWPALVAKELGYDVLNKSIGGQVVQPGTAVRDASKPDPAAIVIQLGTNYRFEPCSAAQVHADIRAYLSEVAAAWPEVLTWVVTPTYHDEDVWPTSMRSCFKDVPEMLASEAARHSSMQVVNGLELMDADKSLLSDGSDHPNAAGNAQIAERLLVRMRKLT